MLPFTLQQGLTIADTERNDWGRLRRKSFQYCCVTHLPPPSLCGTGLAPTPAILSTQYLDLFICRRTSRRNLPESSSSMPALRKRCRSDLLCSRLERSRKCQRTGSASTDLQSATVFWDTLSTIWLTKDALRELDRRNSKALTCNKQPRLFESRRPVTRKFLSDAKAVSRPTEPASEYLRKCIGAHRKRLQEFARRGGPDLSDLKGVSICETAFSHELTMTIVSGTLSRA